MEEAFKLPHKLTLNQREDLSLTGVTEVVSFDDSAVILKTHLGTLNVLGENLVLKSLSVEGGQVAVSGHIGSLIYEEPRQEGFFRRWFQ